MEKAYIGVLVLACIWLPPYGRGHLLGSAATAAPPGGLLGSLEAAQRSSRRAYVAPPDPARGGILRADPKWGPPPHLGYAMRPFGPHRSAAWARRHPASLAQPTLRLWRRVGCVGQLARLAAGLSLPPLTVASGLLGAPSALRLPPLLGSSGSSRPHLAPGLKPGAICCLHMGW